MTLLAVSCDRGSQGPAPSGQSQQSLIPVVTGTQDTIVAPNGSGSSSDSTPASGNDQNSQQIRNLQNEINQLKKQQTSPSPAQPTPQSSPVPPAATQSVPSTANIPALVSEWQNRTAIVVCTYADSTTLQGSALLASVAGYGTTAVTNAHVLINQNGITPPTSCTVANGSGARNVGDSGGAQQGVRSNTFFEPLAGVDMAYIRLSNILAPPTDNGAFDRIVATQGKLCNQNDVSLGDDVLILGYPWDGSKSTVTATQGIVSGFDGNYIVTDAKIDHGNSGGVAVLIKSDCYLGIPSAAVVGTIESYGRILRGNLVFGN